MTLAVCLLYAIGLVLAVWAVVTVARAEADAARRRAIIAVGFLFAVLWPVALFVTQLVIATKWVIKRVKQP